MMKATRLISTVLVLTIFTVPIASARPPYRLQAIGQFQLAPDQDGKMVTNCFYCHAALPPKTVEWNPFGKHVREQFFGDANKNIGQALYLALQKRQDSDGDGFDDVLEVIAKTAPGDAKSKPGSPKDTLEMELKVWGGVDYFKPAAK